VLEGSAGEHESEAAAPGGLRAGRNARIGRLEGEVVGALDVVRVESSGQDQEIPCVTGDAPPDAPHDVRS
jgi:hypothetical protein